MLSRPYRLKAKRDFRNVQTRGQKYIATNFIARSARSQNANPSRFGFSASERVGNAVVRNRAKRRLREAVRRAVLHVKDFQGSTDAVNRGWLVVFNARSVVEETEFCQLVEEVRAAVKYLCPLDGAGVSARRQRHSQGKP
ncbi:MAG: ribonuclease P protein component [Armatimonadota bacterium]